MRLEPITLKARKSFKGIKKGQSFQAVVLAAYVHNLIEMAIIKLDNGQQFDVPYDHFKFAGDASQGE
jgi:hypothetical protein